MSPDEQSRTLTPPLEPLDLTRRETLANEIARRLLDYFLAGHVQPGDRIPSERKLAETLGVGRSVVREALKSLTLLGLIEVRQGDGTYLRGTESDLLPQAIEWGLLLGAKRTSDLVEARRHLEVIIAELAAGRRTEEDVKELRRHFEEMRAATSPDEFVAADVAFHLRLTEAAGNQTLQQIMSSIRALLQVWISRVMRAATDFQPSLDEHVPILAAVERGDSTAARAAMEAHMSGATARLEATLPGRADGAPVG